jgi:hypothetical protein
LRWKGFAALLQARSRLYLIPSQQKKPLKVIETYQRSIYKKPMTIVQQNETPSNEKWDHAIALQIPLVLPAFSSIAQILKAVKLLSSLFGGARVWLEAGTWINNKGHLVWDINVWVKASMSRRDFELHSHQVKAFSAQMCQKLRQEAVVLEINNKEIFLLS